MCCSSRPHSPPSLPPESNTIVGLNGSSEVAAGTAAARVEGKVELPEMKHVKRGKPKRNQVAPKQEDLSVKMSSASDQSVTKRVPCGVFEQACREKDVGSAVRDEAAAKAMQSSSSAPFSKIKHRLRWPHCFSRCRGYNSRSNSPGCGTVDYIERHQVGYTAFGC